jgi:hypothetical protein
MSPAAIAFADAAKRSDTRPVKAKGSAPRPVASAVIIANEKTATHPITGHLR